MKNSNLNENDQISLHTQKDVASLALRIHVDDDPNKSICAFLCKVLTSNHNNKMMVLCTVVLLTWTSALLVQQQRPLLSLHVVLIFVKFL